jgi:hypothetical protein
MSRLRNRCDIVRSITYASFASRNEQQTRETELQFLVVTRRRSDAFPLAAWRSQLLEEEAERVRVLYLEGSVRAVWQSSC